MSSLARLIEIKKRLYTCYQELRSVENQPSKSRLKNIEYHQIAQNFKHSSESLVSSILANLIRIKYEYKDKPGSLYEITLSGLNKEEAKYFWENLNNQVYNHKIVILEISEIPTLKIIS